MLADDGLTLRPGVTSGAHLMLNGSFLGPDRGVLGERRIIGDQGIVHISAVVDFDEGRQLCDPWVETRGWLDADDAAAVIEEIVRDVAEAVDDELGNPDWDRASLLRRVRRSAGTLVNQRSRRRPMIVPVVVDV